jgi:DNA replication protein DnaC
MATKVTLNDEQKEAFKAIQKFIDHPAADTFVLKGYAGTGKTFLMQYLGEMVE